MFTALSLRKQARFCESRARAMTVCIAAACQERGEPRIVLVFDSRLDFGDQGSVLTAVKQGVLGKGWSILLAGDWAAAKYLKNLFKKHFLEAEVVKSDKHLFHCIKATSEDFKESPFYRTDVSTEIILTGFIDDEPRIVWIRDELPLQIHDFCAIGSGANIAKFMLSQRNCMSRMDVSYLRRAAKVTQ